MDPKVRLHVSGDRACFTRPEMKVERVSYDVITPSAARGILDAIHWKPAFRWKIERLFVLNPVRFDVIRRNEVAGRISARNIVKARNAGSLDILDYYVDRDRQQRAALVLRDVAYVIEASVVLTAQADDSETTIKHVEIFARRARRGQCFHQPCLGVREFAAEFTTCEGDPPPCHESLRGVRDLGWMLLDIDFAQDMAAHFFPAVMRDGVIEVPPFLPAAPAP
jgi:CRISPR-associated protein Cas5d